MTHDELLAKVSNYKDAGLGSLVALRAVVELHKPIEAYSNGFGVPPKVCSVCYGKEKYDGAWKENLSYPCPTIQTIEKELS